MNAGGAGEIYLTEAQLPQLWFTPGVRMSRYFAETYTDADGLPVADPCAATAMVPA